MWRNHIVCVLFLWVKRDKNSSFACFFWYSWFIVKCRWCWSGVFLLLSGLVCACVGAFGIIVWGPEWRPQLWRWVSLLVYRLACVFVEGRTVFVEGRVSGLVYSQTFGSLHSSLFSYVTVSTYVTFSATFERSGCFALYMKIGSHVLAHEHFVGNRFYVFWCCLNDGRNSKPEVIFVGRAGYV